MASKSKPHLHLEHRRSHRRRTLKTGKLIFRDGHCVVHCTIRDLSDEGARLELPCHFDLPETLTLSIPGGPSHPCEIVWSSNTDLGVRFLGPAAADPADMRKSLLQRLRLIEGQVETVRDQLNELRREIEAEPRR